MAQGPHQHTFRIDVLFSQLQILSFLFFFWSKQVGHPKDHSMMRKDGFVWRANSPAPAMRKKKGVRGVKDGTK